MRRCQSSTCITVLSRFNDDDYCGACRVKQQDDYINRLREQTEAERMAEAAAEASKLSAEEREAERRRELYAPKGITKDQVIDMLRTWAEAHGRTPLAEEWREALRPGEYRVNYQTVRRHFGTWTAGVVAAGLTPHGAEGYASPNGLSAMAAGRERRIRRHHNAILAVLPGTTAEIAKALGRYDTKNLRKSLVLLEERGMVTRQKEPGGVYVWSAVDVERLVHEPAA